MHEIYYIQGEKSQKHQKYSVHAERILRQQRLDISTRK